MISPSGWEEPGQRPEFEEITVVLKGTLRVEHEGGALDVQAGQGGRDEPRASGCATARPAPKGPNTSRCACRRSRRRQSPRRMTEADLKVRPRLLTAYSFGVTVSLSITRLTPVVVRARRTASAFSSALCTVPRQRHDVVLGVDVDHQTADLRVAEQLGLHRGRGRGVGRHVLGLDGGVLGRLADLLGCVAGLLRTLLDGLTGLPRPSWSRRRPCRSSPWSRLWRPSPRP